MSTTNTESLRKHRSAAPDTIGICSAPLYLNAKFLVKTGSKKEYLGRWPMNPDRSGAFLSPVATSVASAVDAVRPPGLRKAPLLSRSVRLAALVFILALFGTSAFAQAPIRLNQGWSHADSEWFYSTTQGSQLVPYAYYIALEQAGNTKPFNDDANIQKFRALPRPATRDNPDALPVGFVADKMSTVPPGLISDMRSIGFTCAACHTGKITYRGTEMRIDGGPSLADMDGLIVALHDALKATVNDDAKFARFASKVLAPDGHDNASYRKRLRGSLAKRAEEVGRYVRRNKTEVKYGFGRLDAFGRIFNRALELVSANAHLSPNAPVSFPFLWDTPHANSVQWTGSAPNGLIGSLARNVGEVVGVFAFVGIEHDGGWKSSVRRPELKKLERRLGRLKSPDWPENILPAIDQKKADAGEKLFRENCADCHKSINRFPFVDSFKSHMTPVSEGPNALHTDPTAAALIRDSRAPTGMLKGKRKSPLHSATFGDTDYVASITEAAIFQVFKSMYKPNWLTSASRRVKLADGLNESADAAELFPENNVADGSRKPLQYRARPLNGIWATGPFLHNGSVPTLYDLLLPESKRPKVFYVGKHDFDPVKVGPVTIPGRSTSKFDTSLRGNSNKGHDYGTSKMTDDERWALVEYMKTL